MLRYGHYDDILSLTASPEHYCTADEFFPAYQATRLLQKSHWLPTGRDKRAAALERFWDAESSCRTTNEVFKAFRCGSLEFHDQRVLPLLIKAKRKIREVLRPFSPYDFLDHGGFGPGADSDTYGGKTSAYNKFSSPGSVTRECSVFLDFLASNSSLGKLFQWNITQRSIECNRIPGNRVTFVPKDAKTDRSIAVEPRWNVFFQKGMGKVLRKALKRAGTDLDSQELNQELARLGSINGDLATIDLKSASDTVSVELVQFLLPSQWTHVLNALRSKQFTLKGKWYTSEKWSSMGNGYTFELESLIFHSLLASITENFSVYGDDLILPTDKVDVAVLLLNVCGFTVNREKSFVTGVFRESCGSDFFNGTKCTPIYWKDPLHEEGTLRLVNQISRLATRISGGHFRDRRYYGIWRDLVQRLPEHFRHRCPPSISSGVHDVSDAWIKRSRWGWCGWHIRVGLPQSLRFPYKEYQPAVLSQFFSPSTDGYTVRDRIRWRTGTIFIPSGVEQIGPWR